MILICSILWRTSFAQTNLLFGFLSTNCQSPIYPLFPGALQWNPTPKTEAVPQLLQTDVKFLCTWTCSFLCWALTTEEMETCNFGHNTWEDFHRPDPCWTSIAMENEPVNGGPKYIQQGNYYRFLFLLFDLYPAFIILRHLFWSSHRQMCSSIQTRFCFPSMSGIPLQCELKSRTTFDTSQHLIIDTRMTMDLVLVFQRSRWVLQCIYLANPM